MSPATVTSKINRQGGNQAVYFKISVGGELVKIIACANIVGKIYFLNIFFKGQEYISGFADGFPIGSLVTVTVSVWVKEKCFHDLVGSLSGTQFCRHMPSIITQS